MLHDLQVKIALPEHLIEQFEMMDEATLEAYIDGRVLYVRVIDENNEPAPPTFAETEVQHTIEGRLPVCMKYKERCHL